MGAAAEEAEEVDLAAVAAADFMEVGEGSAVAVDLVAEQAADSAAAAREAVWEGVGSEVETLVEVLVAGQEEVDSEVEQVGD